MVTVDQYTEQLLLKKWEIHRRKSANMKSRKKKKKGEKTGKI
jgi:hypothetical protein